MLKRIFLAIGCLTLAMSTYVAVFWLNNAGAVQAQQQRFFQIATAGPSGTYFPIGRIIASAISNPLAAAGCDDVKKCGVSGLLAVAQTSAGSVQNILRISNGKVDSGFAQADVAFRAYRGTGVFAKTGPANNLRVIANLYEETVHFVVRGDAKINSIAELKGKRISIGANGSGSAADARIILEVAGIRDTDFIIVNETPGLSADLLQAGKIDAFVSVAGVPLRAIDNLGPDATVKLLPIDGKLARELLSLFPFFQASLITVGTYGAQTAVKTISVGALWLVSEKLDEKLAYRITRALWNENTRKLLEGGHPRGKSVRVKSALTGVTVPFHPGALRYYREIGLLD